MNPARAPGLLAADPFAARSVIETAASIEPFEWRRGSAGRALARRLGRGRVPERIRTRTTRGAQAWDAWFVVRSDLPRLVAEVEEAAGDELVRGILDRSVLDAWLDQARERPATGAQPPETEVVLQFLAAVRYVRWLQIQLPNAGV
jgi:hypothetical protein